MLRKLSRRTFIQTATGMIVANWGGLQIVAGPLTALARPSEVSRPTPVPQEFIYGTEFFRPPNPPRALRHEMLKAIANEYKFNVIRIYCSWAYLNHEQGKFDFTEIEEVMNDCDQLGLKVLMGAVIEEAPYWLEAAHPEGRFVDALGAPQRLQTASINMSGGWPSLCMDWAPVREAADNFLRELAKVVSRHSSMYAYDVWNEPHLEPSGGHEFNASTDQKLYCYCEKTIASFQSWLKQRYGTLEKLSEAWVRRYPSWDVIDPPRGPGSYVDWVDWRRFMIERSTEEMRFRVKTLRAVDTRSILESHVFSQAAILPLALQAINPWRLAELMETWGLSNFPRWQESPIYFGAAQIELTRAAAAGKPFWITELQGGHGSNGIRRSRQMRPRDIRLWNWMLVAMGGKGIVYWCYLTEATGTESTGFGLVERDGSASERVLEAAQDHKLIQAQWEIIKDYKPNPEVAVLVDIDNALLTFAMSGKEEASTKSFAGYYKALWNSDVLVDFVEPQSLRDDDKYRVIIAPWHLIGKKNTCDHLRRFVEGGGTLLLETGFASYDEHMVYNPIVPAFGLADAFGYREQESLYMMQDDDGRDNLKPEHLPQSERVYVEGHLTFTEPISATIKAHTFLTPIAPASAKVIATYESTPVAATKKVGKGQIYYVGTNLGASIEVGSQAGIELVRTIVTQAIRPTVTSEKVRPRLIESPNGSLLIVFNDQIIDQTARVRVPSRYKTAMNVYDNQSQAISAGSVEIQVPFEGVSVLRLS
ncbi:MAG TPA: beta-galactosidase [Terriglobales bacterium]|nr:beta-galactosidase [Terriglobales bacterium]